MYPYHFPSHVFIVSIPFCPRDIIPFLFHTFAAAARGGDAKSRQEQASRHGVRHSLGTHGGQYLCVISITLLRVATHKSDAPLFDT